MHTIILAGGFGTRLRSVVADLPKPLAPIAGRPFLAWLIDALVAQGVTSITLSVHHQGEKIQEYFSRQPAEVPVDYAFESKPLGTGGAIRYALAQHPAAGPVLVLNGDTFISLDIGALYRQHSKSGRTLTMALREVADTGRYGEVVTEEDAVKRFQPGQPGQPGLINAGVYVLSPFLFDEFDLPEMFSFEQEFLSPHMAVLKPGYMLANDYFIDIGIPEDYARACRELPQQLSAHA